ncbi:MAG TPA: hypothetical protein VFN52_06440, partial [Acidiferrobacteraceae bacterium]|nr:hypothetical protein [Acidiferrobacteraceae bacterium]
MRGAGQRGFLLIAAIVLVVILSFFALVITQLYVSDTRGASYALEATQALFLAESGLQRAEQTLLSPVVLTPGAPYNRQLCSTLASVLTNTAQGAGVFSVSGGPVQFGGDPGHPAVTLNGGLSASATVIPLSVGAGLLSDYAGAGRVLIDREAIDYSQIGTSGTQCGGTAPCLLGVQRGVDGTAAVSHLAGTPVAQAQCSVQAVGRVPGAANADGVRTLGAGVALQQAWMVGSQGSSWAQGTQVSTVLEWLGAPPGGAVVPPTGNNLNSVFCVSYADCWAVGSPDFLRLVAGGGPGPRATVEHWDGSVWTDDSGTLPGAVAGDDLDDVTCTSHNDCWMVGGYTAGRWTLLHLSWSAAGAPVWTVYPWPQNKYKKFDIDSIACVDPSLCWAVGSLRKGQTLLLEWNGVSWSVQTGLLPAGGTISQNNLDLDGI